MLFAALVLLPSLASAQTTTITGTISDSTGGVLPGVTDRRRQRSLRATVSFEGVTDEKASSGCPHASGHARITATLSRFADVMRAGIPVAVGQTVTINLQMAAAGIQEKRHRDRRSAAHRCLHVEPRLQHQPGADGGVARERPELAGPRDAGRRKQGQTTSRAPGSPPQSVRGPTRSNVDGSVRSPVKVGHSGACRLASAVMRSPQFEEFKISRSLRRHAGPLVQAFRSTAASPEGRTQAIPRRAQFGGYFSRDSSSMPRTRCPHRVLPHPISSPAALVRRPDHRDKSAPLTPTTSGSAEPRTFPRGTRRAQRSIFSFHRPPQREEGAAGGWTYQFAPLVECVSPRPGVEEFQPEDNDFPPIPTRHTSRLTQVARTVT